MSNSNETEVFQTPQIQQQKKRLPYEGGLLKVGAND